MIADISPGTIAACATLAVTLGARFAWRIGNVRRRRKQNRQENQREKRQRIMTLCTGSHRKYAPPKKGAALGGFHERQQKSSA